jgi:cytochrome c peroxidase
MSEPAGQACADCHAQTTAFRDPEADHSTSMGVVPGRFGARNSASAMYTALIPELHYDPVEQQFVGGLFWDGRADSLEDQAAAPLLNPLEMNNPDKASVVDKLRRADYAPAFRAVFGPDALDDVEHAFADLTAAVAAFERTWELAPFSSKYDRYLAGTATLGPDEERGLAIFEDPSRGNCAGCHPSRPSADGTPPLFTNLTYHNLGVPAYPNSMFYGQPPPWNPDGKRFVDHGLMTTVGDAQQDGKFRVPTLRNVGRTAPYGHNGYFANLEYFVDFLNTRDVGSTTVGTCSRASGQPMTCGWPGPEVAATMVQDEVGHLGLSENEVDDLVAFLMTLTDEAP